MATDQNVARPAPIRFRVFRFGHCLGLLIALCAGGAFPADSPGNDRASVPPSDPSLLKRLKDAGDYRREYRNLRQRYDFHKADYEAAWEEYQGNLRSIGSYENNLQGWQTFIEEEMRAWERIYDRGHREQAAEPARNTGIRQDEAGPVRFRCALSDEEPEGGWWTRVRDRYQFWKSRFEMVQQAFNALNHAEQELNSHLQRTRGELERLSETTGDSRSFMARELSAWQRIYER